MEGKESHPNDYTTSLAGMKFKIAHRRAGGEKWSATPKTHRKRTIKFLQDVIRDLEKEPEEQEATVVERVQQAIPARKRRRRPHRC